ncbi:MAG: hypothetical protein H0U15_07410 [Geodermatophilaceae bacterium]|nr:hypothetical protein [Geodermatophilaceae bacterium]
MTNTDFYPTDTRARPDEIRRSAEGLESISGVLLGHGDNVRAVLSDVALSFSEVIAPVVAAQIGDNVAALETAVEGTQFGYAVGMSWAADVEAFIAARNELKARWELAEFDDFGVPAPLNLIPPPEAADAERLRLENRVAVKEARSVALDGFILEGHALWESFQEKVTEKARMFGAGPTPENLALVVSFLGWGAMTLWPEIAPAPVSAAEGVTAGTTVIEGLNGAAGPQAVAEALTDVAAIIRRAEAAQELTPAEIDFLAAFYETVGERVPELPGYLAQTSFTYTYSAPTSRADDDSPPAYTAHTVDGLDPSLVTALTAAAANGMLVLSRNGPGGGGYARLPAWVRDALAGDEDYVGPPTSPTSPPIVGVGSDFESLVELAELFDYSSVEAGTGLSHQLAMATQNLAQIGNDAGFLFTEDVAAGVVAEVDSTGRSFLSVIARNDEASVDLILDEDMPDDYDPVTFFADIYSFAWSDDGQAAAGITGVLTDDHDGTAAEQERATRGISDLVAHLTSDPETYERLMDHVGGGDSQESALGQVNPLLAQELGGLMATYFEEFGSPLSPPRDGPPPAFYATADERLRFSTLIATDPIAAETLYASLQDHTADVLAQVPAEAAPYEVGREIGQLFALVDAGIVAAAADPMEDVRNMQEFGLDAIGAVTAAVPHPAAKAMLGVGEALLSGQVEEQLDVDTPGYMLDGAERQYQVVAGLTQGLIDDGQLDGSALGADLVDEDGQIRSIYELSIASDAATGALASAVNGVVAADILTWLLQQLDLGYEEMLAGPPAMED